MSRDHRRLRVFHLADALALDIYKCSNDFPGEERYGLRSQIRRAAVSSASNIVEGCARQTNAEYRNFLNIAAGSTCEVGYLLTLARRLDFVTEQSASELEERATILAKSLFRLIQSVGSRSSSDGLKPNPPTAIA